MENKPKKQHYIPQLWLRNFLVDGAKSLWVFDKRKNQKFQSAIRDVASERYFNDAKLSDEYSISFEPWLTHVENEAAPALAKLVERMSILSIEPDEQAAIAVLFIAQVIRGKAWRASSKQTYELLCERLGGKDKAELAGVPELNEEEGKFSQLHDLPTLIKEFAPTFINKLWTIQVSPKSQPLWIGDEPITRQNSAPTDGLIGNTGLASTGIEIYIPLTPRICLALFCPTLCSVIENGAKYARTVADEMRATRLLEAMNGGVPYLLTQPEVIRLNALQVVHAERFVYSSSGDFRQVEEMLKREPRLKEVPRYVR